MLQSKLLAVAVAASAGLLIAGTDMASAQGKAKKMSYEQAVADCTARVKAAMPGETTQSSPRYTFARGCMQEHGYRLKKGATF